MILPVGVYGSGTWSLTLTEEHRLRIFDNSVLRRIFGSNREEVTGELRRLHNEEHYNLYSTKSIMIYHITTNEMGRACGAYVGDDRCISVLMRKHEMSL
jgi:hypothetical protein